MQKHPAAQGARFFKLHGAGNDLLVVHSHHLPKKNTAAFVRRMAHRQLGLGADQVIEVRSTKPLAIQIWNQDGSRAEMCANGARTFLFLAARQGWIPAGAKRVPLEVSGKPYEGLRTGPGQYEICLGEPEVGATETLMLGKQKIPFTPVRTGNPHAVVWTVSRQGWKAPRDFDYKQVGPQIETHARFPKKTNVEFIRKCAVKGGKAIAQVEVWERGAGATLSCGSGAVAVASVVRQRYKADLVLIKMTDFELRVRFEGKQAYLSGPCALVAEGIYVAR